MKKMMFLVLLGVMVSNTAFGFLGFGKKQEKLYVYNWTEYIPEELLKTFEEEFDCKVIYDMYASNEEMYAKLKAGGGEYDIVFPSSDFTSIMLKQGMLADIDKTKIPNLKNIDKRVMDIAKQYDPNGRYSVPYVMGAAGIAVNTKYVKNYNKDFSIYLKDEYRGKMILLDDMREVTGAALSTLGYSINSTSEKELEEAKQLILKWKKNILKFDAESFGKGFAAEEFWVVHGYAENVYTELEDSLRPYVDFFIPEVGGTGYIDSMVILKDAKNKELAYKFINFILRPEVNAQIVDYLELPSVIKDIDKYRSVKPNYTLDQVVNAGLRFDVGDAVEIYNQKWQEIMIEE